MGLKYRTRYDLIASVLDYCQQNRTIYHIMGNCNLSYQQALDILPSLQYNNLMMYDEFQNKTYITTPKGVQFVKQFRELTDLMNKI